MTLIRLSDTKRCPQCKRKLPKTEFPSKRAYCKLCHSLNTFFYRTGIRVTAQQYLDLQEAQGNVCAICKKGERRTSASGVPYALCLDHCHATKKIRGLLCHSCNKALGHFEDSAEGVQRVITYLASGM
jgi:hypothetical protein